MFPVSVDPVLEGLWFLLFFFFLMRFSALCFSHKYLDNPEYFWR